MLNVYNNLVFIESKSFSQRLCGFVILPALLIFFIPGTTVKAKQLSVAPVAAKELSIAAAGAVVAALRAVRAAAPDLPCEVEVDSLEQLDDVLGEGAELVLLDNFPVWQTQIAVQRRDARSPATKLESSGGLSLDTAAEYAGTGVDYLAVGALTHSVRVLDIGLDI